jgi:hypothetical protein
MSFSRYFDLAPKVAVFALAAAASGVAHAQTAYTIQLDSSRDNLPADGYSRAVITAEVRDREGRLVPDGTEVRFSVSPLGTIDPVATTQAGRARVNLTSAAVALTSTATVTATSGQAFRSFPILFLAKGEKPPQPANVIPMEAQYISYSADHGVLEGLGRVVIRMGRLTVLCDRAQIHADTNRLVAESSARGLGLTFTDGKTSWLAQRLSYNIDTRSGKVEFNGETYDFTGPPLPPMEQLKPSSNPSPKDFAMDDLDDTIMWITAKRVALFPRQRIHFKDAQFRPNGKKVLSLPYYSLPLTILTPEDQIIGLGSQGLTLNLPYYLRLTDQSATSLRLGWNKIEGSLGAYQKGFGLDLQHRIFIGERGEETLNLSRVTSSDWGAWYKHARNWSPTLQTNAYVEFPDHRDLFAAGNAFWQGKSLTAALSATASRPKDFGGTTIADTSVETRPVALGKTGWQYSFISSTGVTVGSGAQQDDFRQSLQARGTLPSWRWDRNTLATATITGGRILSGIHTGATADAVFGVNHQFNTRTSLGLNYNYYYRPGLSALTSKHRVGGQFVTGNNRTNFFTTFSQTLDGGQQTSLINDLTYNLAPEKGLILGLRNTYFRALGIPYSDKEISLTYPIFQRPFTVYYSTQRRQFGFEFSQVGF